MKRLLLFLLLFASIISNAQVFQTSTLYGVQYKRGKFDSTLHPPFLSSNTVLDNLGLPAIKFNSTDTSLRISTDGITYNHKVLDDRDTSAPWFVTKSKVTGGVNRSDSNTIFITPYFFNTHAILQNGNSFGTQVIIGTNDSNGVIVKTENLERFHIYKDGGVSLGVSKEYGANVFAVNKMMTVGDTILHNIGIGAITDAPFSRVTTGNQNVMMGYTALTALTTGSQNIAIGSGSLSTLTVGQFNTAVGYSTGKVLRAGSNNCYFGLNAGVSDTAGSNDVYIGFNTPSNHLTGSNNVFVGSAAGQGHTNTQNSTFIGYNAGGAPGVGITQGATGSVMIGYNAGSGDTTNQKLYIDYNASNTGFATPLIWGDFANSIITFRGNDTVKGNHIVKGQTYLNNLPIYTGNGNGDSILISTGTGNNIQKRAAPIDGNAVLDFPSTLSLSQNTLTISLTGAKVGDPISLGIPSTSTAGVYSAACFSDVVITVIFSNSTASTIDPSSGTFKVKILK